MDPGESEAVACAAEAPCAGGKGDVQDEWEELWASILGTGGIGDTGRLPSASAFKEGGHARQNGWEEASKGLATLTVYPTPTTSIIRTGAHLGSSGIASGWDMLTMPPTALADIDINSPSAVATFQLFEERPALRQGLRRGVPIRNMYPMRHPKMFAMGYAGNEVPASSDRTARMIESSSQSQLFASILAWSQNIRAETMIERQRWDTPSSCLSSQYGPFLPTPPLGSALRSIVRDPYMELRAPGPEEVPLEIVDDFPSPRRTRRILSDAVFVDTPFLSPSLASPSSDGIPQDALPTGVMKADHIGPHTPYASAGQDVFDRNMYQQKYPPTHAGSGDGYRCGLKSAKVSDSSSNIKALVEGV